MEEANKQNPQYLLTVLTKTEKDADKAKETLIKGGADISLTESLGQRDLVHSIAGEKRLYLTSFTFNTAQEKVTRIDEELRHETAICRYLLTRWRVTNDNKKDKKTKAKKAKENNV